MGGLLSNLLEEPARPPPRAAPRPVYNSQAYYQESRDLINEFRNLRIARELVEEASSRHTDSTTYDQEYSNDHHRESIAENTAQIIVVNHRLCVGYYQSIVHFEELDEFALEFRSVKRKVSNINIVVDKIEKITNPYLQKAFELKRQQKDYFYDITPQEKLLFHGTKRNNVDKICKFNFNWRLHGTGTGHRYGQGVSFSEKAIYASHYCDKSFSKVLLLVKVLVVDSCDGTGDMILPPEGYDTTTKNNCDIVVVKYEDNEFYPVYKITFHYKSGFDPKQKSVVRRHQLFN